MGSESMWFTMGAIERALRLGVIVALGLLTYFGALWLLGFRPGDFRRRAAE
jgi:putative peptidoglycan lipid II flippase